MRFDSRADRDAVVDLCPIIHNGGQITMKCVEEARYRFIIHLPWLATVARLISHLSTARN